MRKLFDQMLVSTATYTLCVLAAPITYPHPWLSMPLVVSAAMLVWGAGRVLADRVNRNDADMHYLRNGECPECHGEELAELTSDENGKRIICRDCSRAFAIEPGPKGLRISRLGYTRKS